MISNQINNRDLRIFGFIWTIIFVILSQKFPNSVKLFFSLALFFFAVSAFRPQLFSQIKIYQNWIRFGNILGKINGFLISFILFYGVFSPAGIVLKLMKKDLLNKKLNHASSSYFIDRNLQPGDMKNQF